MKWKFVAALMMTFAMCVSLAGNLRLHADAFADFAVEAQSAGEEEFEQLSPGLHAIAVPNVKQSRSLWCWAASSVAVLGSRGISVTQDNFVRQQLNEVVNQAGTVQNVVNGMRHWGLSSAFADSGLQFGVVRQDLIANRPIVAGYFLQGGSIGHMVVISGLDTTISHYEVMDPALGRKVHHATWDLAPGSSALNWTASVRLR